MSLDPNGVEATMREAQNIAVSRGWPVRGAHGTTTHHDPDGDGTHDTALPQGAGTEPGSTVIELYDPKTNVGRMQITEAMVKGWGVDGEGLADKIESTCEVLELERVG